LYHWLPINSSNLLLCIIAAFIWLAGGIIIAITSEKMRKVGAVSLIFGAAAYLLLALGEIWQEQVEILGQLSAFAWGPALACLAWSGLGIWPGLEEIKSLSFIPIVALLLFLFRLVVTPAGEAEALAFYAPLMSLPLIIALNGKMQGGTWRAIGSAGVAIVLGGPFWLNSFFPGLTPFSAWLGWLSVPAASLLTIGWLRYNVNSSQVGSGIGQS